MRGAVPCLLLALVPTQTLTADEAVQVETIIVNASTLTGVWKITKPNNVTKDGLFGAFKWGPLQDQFCRIAQQDGLKLHCLPGGVATIMVEGPHIYFAWGTMMARMVLDGTLQSPTFFQGNTAVKLAGIGFADPRPSTGVKLAIAPHGPDTGGKSGLLRTILADGLTHIPHDTGASRMTAPSPGEIAQLGAVAAIAYLGQQIRLDKPGVRQDQLDYFSVYAVEFESGERICGLHQRSDSVLDGFLCV